MMRSIWSYLFEGIEDKRIGTLPFSRWDIFLSCVVAIALMAAMAYSLEQQNGWTTKRISLIGLACAFALIAAKNRRVVFGTAFGLIAFRSIVGLVAAPHLQLFVLCATSAMLSWLLLKNLR